MKKAASVFLFLALAVLVLSCSANKVGISKDLQRKWMMVSFKNYKKEDLMKAKANINLQPQTDLTRKLAFMGCNHIFFSADFKANGAVKFSDVGSTMMYCDKMMDLETQFAEELPKMTKYKIEGHFLILSAENGETMKFVASDWD